MHDHWLYSNTEQGYYSGKSDLKDVNRKSRKTVTMCGALHPKSDVDRLYIKRKEGGRSLMSKEHCVREEEINLGFYVANSEENLIKGVTQLRQSIPKIL